ncbi:hypothetical protein B0H17DRAFT_1164564 [Mycena rosella]|uniref:Helitron helicase-like domain-containing protein n=1 Tax=Mycena rosella TaxID=1033263 RepID=A0AAD7FF87_MYCRO|nr:hypothetical protein B0H17DRAFT_1164564 [Mycena rosella]
MKAFISTILAHDPKRKDRDGAQGRGTLHCHMMVWVAGGLNPNQIKQKALEDGGNLDFQNRLITFLDDTISTAVPAGLDIDPSVAADAEAQDISNLVERCQRHRHANTCFKYWKGYPEAKECRFDLDKSNECAISVFDPDTGEFRLRCLDGLVNNFNLTIIRAIRCNMDIKFIGSGPAAKAILHYITDYITKSQLKAHLAVNRLGEFDLEEDDLTSRARKLLQKCAHSMISSQELSSQQVVSYLMDFEDHFTSHRYTNLYWTSFEGFINSEDPSPECYPKKHAGHSSSDGYFARRLDTCAISLFWMHSMSVLSTLNCPV